MKIQRVKKLYPMSDLDADEGLAEICVNEFIADTIKAVKDAGVKKITVEF